MCCRKETTGTAYAIKQRSTKAGSSFPKTNCVMLPKIKASDLEPIAEFLNEDCDGNLLTALRHLNHSVYLFHYLPDDDAISVRARNNTAALLWKLKEAMMDAWFQQMKREHGGGWNFVKMD